MQVKYTVIVSAEDSENNTIQKEVKIIVKNKNRLPILSGVEDIYAMETEIIVLSVGAVDADSDNFIMSFWSTIWWRWCFGFTADGDNGDYVSYVQVTDGTDTVTESF